MISQNNTYKIRTGILTLVLVFCLVLAALFIRFLKTPSEYPEDYTITDPLFSPSRLDADADGIDDYTDIMLGARKYVLSRPKYKSEYYEGGYPDDGYGVCTDVIWNGFLAAGYNLKDMLDKDVADNVDEYPNVTVPDSNIDFRRVLNLDVFFRRHAVSLTTDINEYEEWQAGDIVVYKGHIAICSDKRNKNGQPYILHHTGTGATEADILGYSEIISHYRWY